MITLLDKGDYRLIETKSNIKILYLQDRAYVWLAAPGIGEILVTSRHPHQVNQVLATGRYRLYEVEDEPHLADLQHLELLVGSGKWQSYLLLSGLPGDTKARARLVPTAECITRPAKPAQT